MARPLSPYPPLPFKGRHFFAASLRKLLKLSPTASNFSFNFNCDACTWGLQNSFRFHIIDSRWNGFIGIIKVYRLIMSFILYCPCYIFSFLCLRQLLWLFVLFIILAINQLNFIYLWKFDAVKTKAKSLLRFFIMVMVDCDVVWTGRRQFNYLFLLLTTSAGIATNQLHMPAIPPANSVLPTLNLDLNIVTGNYAFF